MTVVAQVLKGFTGGVPKPKVFDITGYFEPSAHFQYSRRVRAELEDLAREYARSTWMLGSHGGKARLQTDIQGIGVATRLEVGRLAFREDSQKALIQNAFELFAEAHRRGLVSGPIERILVRFSKADQRPREREYIRQAFAAAFKEGECAFLSRERDLLELGYCVAYQTVVQYLREDGLYHSAHRDRIEKVRRHLQQEVGRYENHKFYVRPQAVPGQIPRLDFCYTGAQADRRVEAFMEGYTDVKAIFVSLEDFQAQRGEFVELTDYERASRRYGGLWVLQGDIVRYLFPQQVGLLYLFFGEDLQPELDRVFAWDELFARQQGSRFIPKSMRHSQTFLEMVLEGLVRNGFVAQEEEDRYQLRHGFEDFTHVAFYNQGDYRKRSRM
ncbi:MAG: hypothetical protein AB1505_25955 [Candidatus Latescibacterota bacterium]